MELNKEKQKILEHYGNTLVVANPGTGKTLLLAHKYVKLVKSGVKPEEILCLTFTNKAEKEMEERIIKILKSEGQNIDLSRMKVYTFHSYALEAIGKEETVSANLLRYSVYRYFVDTKALNYGDSYLLETIVPKMENLIRYLKGFGVMPEDIDIGKVKKLLTDYKKLSKEEMDRFAEVFVEVYKHYEEVKKDSGIDYTDMLLEFMKLKSKPKFRYVLVDELQDVNKLEADIALESGEIFFAVGDKKQSIFGFQGGSISNFEKFKPARVFVLSENFRSTNEILNYAKEYFVSKTKDEKHKEDLKDLRNEEKQNGSKPLIYPSADEDRILTACELVKKLSAEGKEVAVIARTNFLVMQISKELEKRGIEHSSTYFSASDDARAHVVKFVRGMLSSNINDVKNAMFTPFFPISLQDAFALSELKKEELTLEAIYRKCPEFRALRASIKTVEDVNKLFKTRIVPVAITYGKEYFLAALTLHEAFNESIKTIEGISLTNVLSYLKASDLLADESDVEKKVTLTTVHKAKGRQFKCVVYVPQQTRDVDNFQDEIVKAILKTKLIDAEEELGEETLRIDFVALTRAEDELHIVPDKMEKYINDFAEQQDIEVESIDDSDSSSRLKRAYALFVNGNSEKSKKLIEDKKPWIREFIRRHFEAIDHISFSSLKDTPEEYLRDRILKMYEYSRALDVGSEVHRIAESVFNEKDHKTDPEFEPYKENAMKLMGEVMKEYPEKVATEQWMSVPLEELVGDISGLMFAGAIDAIFKNKEHYLIVDWKTDKNEDSASKHRQQLEAYRHAYSIANKIPLEKIKVAIAFIGLRSTVNLGKVGCRLDLDQPGKTSFETFRKRVKTVLGWRNDPEGFLKQLVNNGSEDLIVQAIKEEYQKEL